jgi:prepilin-type N-terminal cleavage/methylation domain-containing protein
MTPIHPLAGRAAAPRPRRGFTLLEVLVSMTILAAVMATGIRLFSVQSKAVTDNAGRLDALQTARFALSTIERELRMAGAGTVDAQPMLVLASPTAIAFNVNLVSRDTTDEAAVYQNPDAEPAAVRVFPRAAAMVLPGTSDIYPDTTYMAAAGVASSAETILYYVERDSAASDPLEHVLYRRVNETAPVVVARGLLVGPGDTVFHYLRLDDLGNRVPIPQARQPMLHLNAIHGSPTDTGRLGGLIDSVRTVRIRFRAAYTSQNTRSVRMVESVVRLMNAGLMRRTTCGEAPIGTSAVATPTFDANGVPIVQITWNRSLDENAGERDVEMYAVYRRDATATGFGEPLVSVPAGQAVNSFVDTNVRSGEAFTYGIAALDCTPKSSSITATSTVLVP